MAGDVAGVVRIATLIAFRFESPLTICPSAR